MKIFSGIMLMLFIQRLLAAFINHEREAIIFMTVLIILNGYCFLDKKQSKS